jgi:hypothetical protein
MYVSKGVNLYRMVFTILVTEPRAITNLTLRIALQRSLCFRASSFPSIRHKQLGIGASAVNVIGTRHLLYRKGP